MALPESGPLSLSDIQTEFGGVNPIALSEYYRGGAYVTDNNTGVPTSGEISIGDFYGAVLYGTWDSAGDFIVPSGVTAIRITALGGGGGAGGYASAYGFYAPGGAGGKGGKAYHPSLAVTPGETLVVAVGGAGSAGASNIYYPSGGSSYYKGNAGTVGGPTSVKRGATTLAQGNGGGGGGGGLASQEGFYYAGTAGVAGSGSVASGGTVTPGFNTGTGSIFIEWGF